MAMDETTVNDGGVSQQVDQQVSDPTQAQASGTGDSLLKPTQQEQEQPAQKIIPEKYELKIPEGVKDIEADEVTTAEFGDMARRMQLTQEEAQELYEYGVKKMGDGMEAVRLQILAKKEEWRKKSEQTPEITQGLDGAKNLIRKFGTPELDQFFEESGAGCNPEFLKFLCAVGDVFKQDTLVLPRKDGQGERSFNMLDRANALYPNM